MRATVSHFELPARDIDRAAEFYRTVFDWQIDPVDWDGGYYLRIGTDAPASPSPRDHRGAIQGGLGLPETIGADQPLLVIHLTGETLEEGLDRIEEAGGQREGAPRAIGSYGRMATFHDTEGNRLGLWTASGRR